MGVGFAMPFLPFGARLSAHMACILANQPVPRQKAEKVAGRTTQWNDARLIAGKAKLFQFIIKVIKFEKGNIVKK